MWFASNLLHKFAAPCKIKISGHPYFIVIVLKQNFSRFQCALKPSGDMHAGVLRKKKWYFMFTSAYLTRQGLNAVPTRAHNDENATDDHRRVIICVVVVIRGKKKSETTVGVCFIIIAFIVELPRANKTRCWPEVGLRGKKNTLQLYSHLL